MGYVGIMNVNDKEYPVGSTLYGTCATQSGDPIKVVNDMPFFNELKRGVAVFVKFIFDNTAANPLLNVNNTGLLPIYKFGTIAPLETKYGSWKAGEVVFFVYDGESWRMGAHNEDSFEEVTADDVAAIFIE